MRHLHLILVAVLLEAVLVGCDDDSKTASSAEPATAASSAPARRGAAIPDGDLRQVRHGGRRQGTEASRTRSSCATTSGTTARPPLPTSSPTTGGPCS